MAMQLNVIYHWTHRDNVESILRIGVDPSMATGELYAVWGCRLAKLCWAREHVCSRHGWSPEDVVLLRLDVRRYRCYRTAWPQVFYTPQHISPDNVSVVPGPSPGEPQAEEHQMIPRRPAA